MQETRDRPLSFSLIIPTKNEAQDIAGTIEACLAIDHPQKEIIVVDDSTDETPQIAERYADRGVTVIHRERNENACCGARNLGMQRATGDVIVVINGDARPSPDFLERLIPHYEQGADLVVVRSRVKNRDQLWGRYIYGGEMVASERWYDRLWSEGYSCRREAAQAVGYIPGDFPVPFCRDNTFTPKLLEAGFVKHQDLDIEMEHLCPVSLAEYWGVQVHRGAHHAPSAYYFRNMSLARLIAFEVVRALRVLIRDLLIVPVAYRAFRRARHCGWRYFPQLTFAGYVEDIGLVVGNFKGFGRLLKAGPARRRPPATTEPRVAA